MIRLLVKHGASVHETIGDRTIGTLTLHRSEYSCETLVEMIRFLISECYTDFNFVDNRGYSIHVNVARNEGRAVEAFDLLASAGMSAAKIFPDGRSLLHLAAEHACKADFLEHLYNKYGLQDVNKQDRWGWTPLHWAFRAMAVHVGKRNLSKREKIWKKVAFLLRNGADAGIRARPLALAWYADKWDSDTISVFEYASLIGDGVRERLEKYVEEAKEWRNNEADDIFYDAEE
jgi:hypothetical protein